MGTTMIADAVEEMLSALKWTNEANALGDVECNWSADDTNGWLTMGTVRVEWLRDAYGDGQEDWIAVNVLVDGAPFDTDGYSHLDEAVKDAARTTMEWQRYCANEIRGGVVEWLEDRGEAYNLDGSQGALDSWTITWGDVMVLGDYDDDGAFAWSVLNPESRDCLNGDASDDADVVIDAMAECARDSMVDAWVETVAVETAEDSWAVRTSMDQMTMYMHSLIAYGTSRRAYYEPTGYEEGRIELEYRARGSEWRLFEEHLPEDEEDVRRMAGEAYAWVKAVDA
jgi:hypothetical protein|nr:MAG TPA: hypothetical protein [Caudoviricetes sp.]